MPNIFKALASITAWVLFIWGCIGILIPTIAYFTEIGILNPPPTEMLMSWALATAVLTLSVVVMRLRQKME